MRLVEIEDLHVSFSQHDGLVRAVRGVSFALQAGESLGIVGESGSGKSVTCSALMKLLREPPAKISAKTLAFLASAGNLSMIECADILRKAFPAYAGKLPRITAPDWTIRLAGAFDSDLHGVAGSLGIVRNVDSSAAEALLGYKLFAPPTALTAMAQSLVAQKLA